MSFALPASGAAEGAANRIYADVTAPCARLRRALGAASLILFSVAACSAMGIVCLCEVFKCVSFAEVAGVFRDCFSCYMPEGAAVISREVFFGFAAVVFGVVGCAAGCCAVRMRPCRTRCAHCGRVRERRQNISAPAAMYCRGVFMYCGRFIS